MATKNFYHDIDLVKVGQLTNFRVHNVTTAERTSLAGTLNTAHKALLVYDTDLSAHYSWNGSAFVAVGGIPGGALTPKDNVAHNATEPASPAVGDWYLFTSAGTNTWEGSTDVEINDSAWWNGSAWKFIQANVVNATETVKGVVELASTAEAQAGSSDAVVMTPAKTKAWTDQNKFAKTYFASGVTLTADTPFSVAHNLSLQNRNSFVVNVVDSAHSAISVDVDSTDQNNLTLTSSVTITNVHITVIGF